MTDNKNDVWQQTGALQQTDAKQRLLKLIIEQGILHDSAERPVIARDGKTRLSWVMNFLAISLHADSLRLAAQETLRLLEAFDGRQLATIGTAAVPLLSACVLESQGRYNGLMVRAKRKAYGTASLIDGRINYSESVVVIDDSIGSGTNMLDCIEKLEQSGLHVEGCVCLVRFGYDSGYGKLIDRGYRVAALFDIHEDISPHHSGDWQYSAYPIWESFRNIVWDEQCLPDYISPFPAIRQSMLHYWQTGKLLSPPQRFNQSLDTTGGVWLSLRAQDAVFTSQGRHGFWHFPGKEGGEAINACLDISRVAWLFACYLRNDPHREQRLEQSALGLSLFGALETCEPGEFDQCKHALVVRSEEAPWKMGGALPDMPGISSDARLLHHARFNNTKLYTHEPFQLYRHTVRKLVEPGAEWPQGGESQSDPFWDEKKDIAQPIAEQMLDWVKDWQKGKAWPEAVADLYMPVACQWLFLSVYISGKQVACVGTVPQQASDLLHLVQNAAQDPRWQAVQTSSKDDALYIRISLLSQSRYLGCAANLQSFANFVMGKDALAIQQDQQFGIILPEVPVQQQWSVADLSNALYQKAGITQQSNTIHWRSYRTATWHVDDKGCHLISPEKPLPPSLETQVEPIKKACMSFLRHHRQLNGIVNSGYNPALHQVSQQDALFNTAYVLWLTDLSAEPVADWQHCYQYLEQELQSDSISHLERSYAMLALLKQAEISSSLRRLLAGQLDLLQSAFDMHGQLSRSERVLQTDHYGIELRVLLIAQQHGFFIDQALIKKGLMRLLRYTQYQATPRQYPALLETLYFAGSTDDELIGADGELQETINNLGRVLLSWQQPSGAFLPEAPQLSPVLYTLRVINALVGANIETAGVVESALSYIQGQIVLPEHQACFSTGAYAVGGIGSGLPDVFLMIPATALFLKVQRQFSAQEKS